MAAFLPVKIQSRLSADPPVRDTRYATASSVGGDIRLVFVHRNGGVDSSLVASRNDLYEGLGFPEWLGTDDQVADMDQTPNGEILVAVNARTRKGESIIGVLRYAGSTRFNPLALDTSFGLKGVIASDPTFEDWKIGAMAPDREGRALIAINHRLVESVTVDGQRFPPEDWLWVARMGNDSDGEPDFRPDQNTGPMMRPLLKHFRATDMVVDKKRRIVIVGERRLPGQSTATGVIVRLHPDGKLDQLFGDPVVEVPHPIERVLIDRDGKILISMVGDGDVKLTRLHSDPVGTPRPDTAVCGDGDRHLVLEECDDGNTVSFDGCSATCRIEEPDADGDRLPDERDLCTDVEGTRKFAGDALSRLTVKGLATPGKEDNSVFFEGEIQMPGGMSFATFNPSRGRGGLIALVTGADGRRRFKASLGGAYAGSGTTGWQKSGSTWTFFGNLVDAELSGVTRALVTDLGNGRVKVSVSAKSAGLAKIGAAEMPLQAVVLLQRLNGASQRGECGESRFTPSQCQMNETANAIACRN
jgi:cysteine-rich repeat protein